MFKYKLQEKVYYYSAECKKPFKASISRRRYEDAWNGEVKIEYYLHGTWFNESELFKLRRDAVSYGTAW